VYVDAVHFAPHGPIDVQQLDCDFLVCSAYKFFGPHVGMLYGRYELLDQMTAYKVRPAPNSPPGKFETGTQNFEGIAGVLGALEYFEWLGEKYGIRELGGGYSNRKFRLKQAMTAIRAYESELSQALLEILEETPGIQIYGLRDIERLEERVPTFAFTLKGFTPQQVAEELGRRNIYVWDGNYYAISVTESLGVEETGGMVRVGPVHYNTMDEIHRFGKVLGEIAAS
jgi:selenocysteine lyase/cysteine desulfurase